MAGYMGEKQLCKDFLHYVPAQCAYRHGGPQSGLAFRNGIFREAQEFLSNFNQHDVDPKVTPALLTDYFIEEYVD